MLAVGRRRRGRRGCGGTRAAAAEVALELGDALGMSEVYANRMLQRLQKEGLIDRDHRTLRIPDLEALKTVAEFDMRYLHLETAPPALRDVLTQVCASQGGD